mmetsp:Transcript_34593/g.95299  ORF Transcript_34593/g.95299 Transcript_34593/m.95299 type:complete len:436 (+) Transcript_34593:86-1393(+)
MDYAVALLLAVSSMILWGSWANTFLLSRVRFELFFFDYIIGNVMVGLISLLTATDSLKDTFGVGLDGALPIAFAVFAGLLYASGTLFMVSAVNLSGLAFAVPVVLGIEFALGVPLMLVVEGLGSTSHAVLSFCGVVMALLAVLCDCECHSTLSRARCSTAEDEPTEQGLARQLSLSLHDISLGGIRRLRGSSMSLLVHPMAIENMQGVSRRRSLQPGALSAAALRALNGNHCSGRAHAARHSAPAVIFPTERMVEEAATTTTHVAEVTDGGFVGALSFATCAGVFFAVWPCFADIAKGNGRFILCNAVLDPGLFYSILVFGAFSSALVLVPLLCHRPLDKSEPIAFWSSYCRVSTRGHVFGVLGGLLQGGGTLLTLLASDALGGAVSMSITRCTPGVTALLGRLVCEEMDCATRKTLVFLCAVACLGLAGLMSAE